MKEDSLVAIVGMGVLVPGASNCDEFWQLLNNPRPVFAEPRDRFDIEAFWSSNRSEPDRTYSRIAGYIHDRVPDDERGAKDHGCEPRETIWLRHCLRQARMNVALREADRLECIVGAWPGGSQARMQSALVNATATEVAARFSAATRDEHQRRLTAALHKRFPHASDHPADALTAVREAAVGILPTDPVVLTVDTACASSLYALDIGAKHLRSGACDVAFCGGFSVLEPTMSVLFAKIGGLSPSGALRALDQAADGTLFSDAAALLTLKTLARAYADGDHVFGVLGGIGAASDGRGRSIAAPNPRGQTRAMRRAHDALAAESSAIDWVIAHATGTTAGDSAELEAMGEQAPESGWICTATKSVIGHAGWAAGALAVVHALLAIREETIPPQQHFTAPSRDVAKLRIPREAVSWPPRSDRPRVVGVSAFGFGGTNAHVLVREAPSEVVNPPSPENLPAQIGARTSDSNLDPLVLVGWSGHVPGRLDKRALQQWLAGVAAAPTDSFGGEYPMPDFAAVGLPAPTVHSIDRCQIMGLEVAQRFVTEYGELWADLRESTGVIAAHSGIPAALRDYSVRCHADQLTALLVEHKEYAASFSDYLEKVRRRTPPANADSMPGVLPNVVPSRLTARYDLSGASITVDTGDSSALAAITVASDYLIAGELDLALVLAVDGGNSPDVGGATEGTVAEGAFLLALSRESTARERGWTISARLVPGSTAPIVRSPNGLADRGPAFHSAGGAVDLLRAIVRGESSLISANGQHTVAVTVPQDEHPDDVAALTSRYTPVLRPAPLRVTKPAPAAIPPGALVLVDSASVATAIAQTIRRADATLVCTDGSQLSVGIPPMGDLLRAFEDGGGNLRVIVRHDQAWPTLPPTESQALHALLFKLLSHARTHAVTGSLGILVIAADDHPHSALLTGLVPSLIADYPELPLRIVVTDNPTPDAGLELLAAEWTSSDSEPATWHHAGTRNVERLVPHPYHPVHQFPLEDGAVIVASGGSGGVMTEILSAIAEAVRPTVWILGSSNIDGVSEELLADDDLLELRARLIARALTQNQHQGRTVADAVAEADRLLAGRRSFLNLRRLQAALGPDRLHHLTCDVTDPTAALRAAAEISLRHNQVDLFIHAAARIRTGPLGKKSAADFQLVRDVKVLGYHNLRSAFAPLRPRLWCNVASVAAVYPLAGEIDYGPANAFLMAAASQPGQPNGTREITIGFPLWSESGFLAADPTLITQLTRRGRLTGILDREGVGHFLAELDPRRTGPAASVYLGERERRVLLRERPGYLVEDHVQRSAPAPRGPAKAFLAQRPEFDHDGARWQLNLDPEEHSYLRHHLAYGEPAVPGTFLLAMAAEAASALVPDGVPIGVLDASFESFVRPLTGRGSTRFEVEARRVGQETTQEAEVMVELRSVTTMPGSRPLPPRLHFSARVRLGEPQSFTDPNLGSDTSDTEALPPDPYYYPAAPVQLSGPFVNTRRWRRGGDAVSALWLPAPATLGEHPLLGRLALPGLLICATLRTGTLPPAADGSRHVVVPRRIARMDIYAPWDDVRLAARYPMGIATRYQQQDDSFTAAVGSQVLLRITGFEGTSLGALGPLGGPFPGADPASHRWELRRRPV